MAQLLFDLTLTGTAPDEVATKEQLEDGINASVAQAYTDMDAKVAAEAALRAAADATLQDNIDDEETARIAADALKAPLASPALTGTPTAPTAAPGTNTTQIATTAFTNAAVAASAESASISATAAANSQAEAAAASASAAQSARDAAFVNANVFADIATGRAAVADGQQFQVATGDEIIRYRRDSSSTQTEVARYPAGRAVTALGGQVGALAAVLGQAQEEVERLSVAQEGDVYTLRTLLEALSLIGQISDQINGGQVALRGGSPADPALRIGTAGIYSSAADTLSIAIAGSEVARFTASGLTVYGTVTEA